MNKALVFDTETTGLPDWKTPSEGEGQPHIVDLAAILYDGDTEVDRLNVIVRPDGWVIPQDTIDLHGITMEQAMDEGIAEAEALERFLALVQRADVDVAHNTTFDERIIRIAMMRYRDEAQANSYRERAKFCTMFHSRDICRLPAKRGGLYKSPKLSEAYQHFFGEPLEGAHRALPDALGCARIFHHLRANHPQCQPKTREPAVPPPAEARPEPAPVSIADIDAALNGD